MEVPLEEDRNMKTEQDEEENQNAFHNDHQDDLYDDWSPPQPLMKFTSDQSPENNEPHPTPLEFVHVDSSDENGGEQKQGEEEEEEEEDQSQESMRDLLQPVSYKTAPITQPKKPFIPSRKFLSVMSLQF